MRWQRLQCCALLEFGVAAAAQKLPLDIIKLPPGFEIALFADNVPNARDGAERQGHLLVGSMRAGKVYAVRIRDDDGKIIMPASFIEAGDRGIGGNAASA